MIDNRAAVGDDVGLHGARFILLECGAGAIFFGGLGVVECVATAHAQAPFLRAQSLFFLSLMVNCLTLLIVARRLAHGRATTIVTRADLDPRRVRRYTRALPLLILCPLLLPFVVVSQKGRGGQP